MLCERSVADISLRELSDRVGLAKSNVLRYFDSREAIFLEVMDSAWIDWLDGVEAELREPAVPHQAARFGRETVVASVIAASLARRRLLCELISVMAGVLERNISIEFARSFKQRAAANSARLAGLVRTELPHLDESACTHFAGAVFVLVAGLWPYATPTEAVRSVMREMGSPTAEDLFAEELREGLINQLVGLSARAGV